ncbi:hypothetical protein [Photobacterium lutimaris]|uniref:hypothetical protein n=1 Tax=Photobacterium lutimaris TaxID=388278 RepID=UPI001414E574|nr:hypothetical protein [Photobacterium lutimaris]
MTKELEKFLFLTLSPRMCSSELQKNPPLYLSCPTEIFHYNQLVQHCRVSLEACIGDRQGLAEHSKAVSVVHSIRPSLQHGHILGNTVFAGYPPRC